jgi:hypothetical protein
MQIEAAISSEQPFSMNVRSRAIELNHCAQLNRRDGISVGDIEPPTKTLISSLFSGLRYFQRQLISTCDTSRVLFIIVPAKANTRVRLAETLKDFFRGEVGATVPHCTYVKSQRRV